MEGLPNWATFLLSLVGGSGAGALFVKLYIKDTAKKALETDLGDLKANLVEIKQDIKEIKHDFVTCVSCEAKHSGIDTILKSMDKKLDIVVGKL